MTKKAFKWTNKIKLMNRVGLTILITDMIYTWFIWHPIPERGVSAFTLGELIYSLSPVILLVIGIYLTFYKIYGD